jgi:hypothetical protein
VPGASAPGTRVFASGKSRAYGIRQRRAAHAVTVNAADEVFA